MKVNIVLVIENPLVLYRLGEGLKEHDPVFFQSIQSLNDSRSFNPDNSIILLHDQLAKPPAVAYFVSAHQSSRIVVMSDRPHGSVGVAYLVAGAYGYINTFSSMDRIEQVIETVSAGNVWVGQKVIQALIAGIASRDQEGESDREIQGNSGLSGLTGREVEIAECVLDGMSNKDIANKLGITERTVKAHLNSIYGKTGVKGRLQLALKLK